MEEESKTNVLSIGDILYFEEGYNLNPQVVGKYGKVTKIDSSTYIHVDVEGLEFKGDPNGPGIKRLFES